MFCNQKNLEDYFSNAQKVFSRTNVPWICQNHCRGALFYIYLLYDYLNMLIAWCDDNIYVYMMEPKEEKTLLGLCWAVLSDRPEYQDVNLVRVISCQRIDFLTVNSYSAFLSTSTKLTRLGLGLGQSLSSWLSPQNRGSSHVCLCYSLDFCAFGIKKKRKKRFSRQWDQLSTSV